MPRLADEVEMGNIGDVWTGRSLVYGREGRKDGCGAS